MADKKIREHFVFEGRVQGVGFRWKLRQLAGMYGVTGWVTNEYDGTVTAELQGKPEELDMILQQMNRDRYICIEHAWRSALPVDEKERSFRVR